MKRDRFMTTKVLLDLEDYFAGRLEGYMGMISPTGSVLAYGCRLPTAMRSAPEPTAGAVHAARTSLFVRATLRRLSVEIRAVLHAWCNPLPGLVLMGDRQIESVARLIVGKDAIHRLAMRSSAHAKRNTRAASDVRAARTELRDLSSRTETVVKASADAYTKAAAEQRNDERDKPRRWQR